MRWQFNALPLCPHACAHVRYAPRRARPAGGKGKGGKAVVVLGKKKKGGAKAPAPMQFAPGTLQVSISNTVPAMKVCVAEVCCARAACVRYVANNMADAVAPCSLCPLRSRTARGSR